MVFYNGVNTVFKILRKQGRTCDIILTYYICEENDDAYR